MTRKRITAEERERARRDQLARNGRITDGSITETQWVPEFDDNSPVESDAKVAAEAPTLLIYRYEIAGVTYECAQDVTRLSDLVSQIRVDLPVQVRFDPRNPGNSIVVAETWNGLRLASNQPLKPTLGTPALASQSEPS